MDTSLADSPATHGRGTRATARGQGLKLKFGAWLHAAVNKIGSSLVITNVCS